MSQKLKRVGLTIGLGISLAISSSVQANTQTFLFNNQLEFIGLDSQYGYELRIRLPQGELKSLFINPTESISFEATDFAIKSFQDGMYKYELLPLKTSHKNRLEDSNKVEPLPTAEIYSGVFTVKNGTILIDQDEPTRDQVIADDLIVQGSACIGQDCVNGESFGFDTLRLKENNLRIKFMDTSNSGSFPTTDWELTANDSANGGANRFSITDIDAGRAIFTVEGGAPANSLYVESDGDVGFGTTNPVVKAHLSDGDSPTVRLEQNGTNGWTPQIWDLAGNETNFFIRDATNGSTLPFRIRPGAPTNSIYIDTDGDVGMGTNAPDSSLQIQKSNGTAKVTIKETIASQAARSLLQLTNNGNPEIVMENSGTSTTWTLSAGNKFVLKNNLGETIMTIDSDGNMVLKGTITPQGL